MAITINGSGTIGGATTLSSNVTLADVTADTLTVDTTTLVVDEANNRVGIGTASPAVTFDVSGYARASSGILFGTDTAAANALDDYEEGTWTPNVYNNGQSSSWTTAVGTYTKIGNICTAHFHVDTGQSGATSGGALVLGPLPFNIAGMASGGRVLGTIYSSSLSNSPEPIFFYGGTSPYAQIWYSALSGQDQARTTGASGFVIYPVG